MNRSYYEPLILDISFILILKNILKTKSGFEDICSQD